MKSFILIVCVQDSFLTLPRSVSLSGKRFSPYAIKGERKLKNKNKNAIRTIVCLPLQFAEDYSITSKIVIPRGKCREKLHEKQLIAKINIKKLLE